MLSRVLQNSKAMQILQNEAKAYLPQSRSRSGFVVFAPDNASYHVYGAHAGQSAEGAMSEPVDDEVALL